MHYRCYFLNLRSEIAAIEIIEAADDADALDRADTLFREKGAGFSGVAVWDRARRVQRESKDGLERIRRWRMKAEEIRTTAEGFSDGSARQHLHGSARTYEALANAAEARLERGQRQRPEELREQSRLSRQASLNASTIEERRAQASLAFALAQLAEKIEREQAEAAAKKIS